MDATTRISRCPTDRGGWSKLAFGLFVTTTLLSSKVALGQYNEKFETWTATSANTWQTRSLSGAPYNIPASAVVEIAVRNASTSTGRSAGVRAVGSSLERRFTLGAATGGGTTVLVMHVQTDSSSQIQHYAANTTDVDFVLLGYWDCGTYVERMQLLTPGAWVDIALSAYGVAPNGIAEVVMENTHPTQPYLMGSRTNGSTLERRVIVSPDGVFSMLVKADSSSSAIVEGYSGQAQADQFLVGYWAVAPGTYTELFSSMAAPSADGVWEDKDLTGNGVSDGNIVEILFGNDDTDEENRLGARSNGSSLTRSLQLRQESADDGTFGRMHVATDAGAAIEFFHEDVSDLHSFRVVGQWNVGTILSDHLAGQAEDAFHENGSETNAQLFAFKLSPCDLSLTVTQLAFRLTSINGLVNGDWAGVELLIDSDADGIVDVTETTSVGGSGVVNQAAGTITFSTSFNVTAETHYILRADFGSLSLGDQVTIGLSASDFTASDPVTGSTTSVTHKERVECYFEEFEVWTATLADTWETQSLSGFGVPANAVVEIAIRNGSTTNERSGGVRQVGSTLERRLTLREAEDGGVDVLVMHVQSNASSQIQHYSDVTSEVDFVLLGYWTCGSYVESFDTFTAGASGAWTDRSLCPLGIQPGHVAEIVMANDDVANEREAGVRTNGSSLQRRLNLTEAEDGGVDTGTLFVEADSSVNAVVEVYAQDDTDVDFYLVGSWDEAPLAFTELFADLGSPSASNTWQDRDLSAEGISDAAHAEIVMSNEDATTERSMGIRNNGSSLSRALELTEAQDGGADLSRMHIASDVTATVEWLHSNIAGANSFYLTGEWDSCSSNTSYIVTDLGAINAARSSLGVNINETGAVAGFEEDSSGNPTAWSLDCGSFTSLGTLGGSFAEAHGINDAGRIVGWAHNAGGKRRAFTYSGSMSDLGVTGSRTDSEAQAVNSADEVVGTVYNFGSPPSNRLAFLYLPIAAHTLSSGMNSLGTLGGTQSQAFDINDAGQVVGGAQNASGQFRPFRWQDGVMTDMGTLGGNSTNSDHRAESINSLGAVCGRSYTAAGARRGFLWDGSMTDLGVLTGGTESWAFGINDDRTVVGTSNVSGGAYHAFIWDQVNGMRDLNDLIPVGSGWTMTRATDVNNDGSIVGWGTNGSGNVRAFLLTPTCRADGGAAAVVVLASGEGVTDSDGVFHEVIEDSSGQPLAEVEWISGLTGSRVEYQILEVARRSDMGPDDPRSRPGFRDGRALRRTLRVETGTAGDAVLTVSMVFSADEVEEADVDPAEIELHYFDALAPGGGRWKPVGENIGQASPTAVFGESGWIRHRDGSLEYWGVRDRGGEFAVGKALEDETPDTPRPVPRGCGPATLPCFLIILIGLSFFRRLNFWGI